jgi:hypothetical protein
VTVPVLSFFTKTFAPINSSPDKASMTYPEIVYERFGTDAEIEKVTETRRKMIRRILVIYHNLQLLKGPA